MVTKMNDPLDYEKIAPGRYAINKAIMALKYYRQVLTEGTSYNRIYETIEENPGINQSELMSKLRVSQSVIAQKIYPLIKSGLIERKKDGKFRKYTVTEVSDKMHTAIWLLTEKN